MKLSYTLTVIHFPVIRVCGYDNKIGELPIQFVVGQDLPTGYLPHFKLSVFSHLNLKSMPSTQLLDLLCSKAIIPATPIGASERV